MRFRETGLPWVFPSPNMPTPGDGARLPRHVPARGDEPVRGARHHAARSSCSARPGSTARALAEALARRAAPRRARSARVSFVPTWDKHAGVALPRRRAARHRPRRGSARSGPGSPACSTRGAQAPERFALAHRAVRVRGGRPRLRPPLRLGARARGDRGGGDVSRARAPLGAEERAVRPPPEALPPLRRLRYASGATQCGSASRATRYGNLDALERALALFERAQRDRVFFLVARRRRRRGPRAPAAAARAGAGAATDGEFLAAVAARSRASFRARSARRPDRAGGEPRLPRARSGQVRRACTSTCVEGAHLLPRPRQGGARPRRHRERDRPLPREQRAAPRSCRSGRAAS